MDCISLNIRPLEQIVERSKLNIFAFDSVRGSRWTFNRFSQKKIDCNLFRDRIEMNRDKLNITEANQDKLNIHTDR